MHFALLALKIEFIGFIAILGKRQVGDTRIQKFYSQALVLGKTLFVYTSTRL